MHSEERTAAPVKVPLILLVDSVIGTLIGLGLLLLGALLVWGEFLPESLIRIWPIACLFLSSALSGFLSGKTLGRGLIIGIVQGIVSFAFLYLMGLLIFVRLVPSVLDPYGFLACIFGGILGGLLSAGRIKNYRKKPKKLRGLL